jgi:cation:H+ antiporter
MYAAAVILLSAEPFVDSLIETGRQAQIDEFMLIQWIAPLASESPEMLIAIYFSVRGKPRAALTMLISSTVNQWTLLVGSLPVAYSLSFGAPASLPLDWRQQVEFLLAMSQTLFAILLVSRKTISWPGASLLLGLFVAQLASSNTEIRLAFSIAFLVGAAAFFVGDKERRQQILQIPGFVSEAIRA